MEVGEELAKESSFVYWNNAVYLDETALYGRDVTHKKRVAVSERIQSKEQE